jgi:DNA modification methylase
LLPPVERFQADHNSFDDQLYVDFEDDSADPGDEVDRGWQVGPTVSERGSLWILDQHRLLCGDARREADLDRLMSSSQAAMAFLDVPYNVRVRDIGGRGRIKHLEFAFASGEMSRPEYVEFLKGALGNCSRVSRDGALQYVCCDWRHVSEIIEAGGLAYGEVLNIVVWVKSNAGQGSFYRSQHEFIVVFRIGKAAHLNNIELGRHGRSRSNVWAYRGVNTFSAGRMDELRSHPTVKPVALVADATRDCTRRREIILDTFSGSGTTIMAAERIGRCAYAMEIEPRCVDVAIRRWQASPAKTLWMARAAAPSTSWRQSAPTLPKTRESLPRFRWTSAKAVRSKATATNHENPPEIVPETDRDLLAHRNLR